MKKMLMLALIVCLGMQSNNIISQATQQQLDEKSLPELNQEDLKKMISDAEFKRKVDQAKGQVLKDIATDLSAMTDEDRIRIASNDTAAEEAKNEMVAGPIGNYVRTVHEAIDCFCAQECNGDLGICQNRAEMIMLFEKEDPMRVLKHYEKAFRDAKESLTDNADHEQE